MNKYIVPFIVVFLVGLGLGFLIQSGTQPSTGGVTFEEEQFPNGLKAGSTDQFSVSAAGVISTSGGITSTGALSGATYSSASVGSSSSSPAALGSAVSGHLVVAAGSATASASTTAVTANSTIILTQEATTPIAGTTCNTGQATTSPTVTSKITGNGFIVGVPAPATNPLCLGYLIFN